MPISEEKRCLPNLRRYLTVADVREMFSCGERVARERMHESGLAFVDHGTTYVCEEKFWAYLDSLENRSSAKKGQVGPDQFQPPSK